MAVVGGGPAGWPPRWPPADLGCEVTLIDAGSGLGGQLYRPGLLFPGRGQDRHAATEQLPPRLARIRQVRQVRHLAATSAGPATRDHDGVVTLWVGGLEGGAETTVEVRAVVLATGASELVLPFPGWDLPGVTTAGAAQALLKSQGVTVGRRVLVGGSGPLLLPVAARLAEAGVHVVAVLEATPAPAGLPRRQACPRRRGGPRLVGRWTRPTPRCWPASACRYAPDTRWSPAGRRPGGAGRDRPAGPGLAAGTRLAAGGDRGCRARELRLLARAGTAPRAGLRRGAARIAAGRRGRLRHRPSHIGARGVRGRPGDRGHRRGGGRAGGIPGRHVGRALPGPRAPGRVRGAHPGRCGPAWTMPGGWRRRSTRPIPLPPGWLEWPDAGTVVCRCQETRWSESTRRWPPARGTLPAVQGADRLRYGLLPGARLRAGAAVRGVRRRRPVTGPIASLTTARPARATARPARPSEGNSWMERRILGATGISVSEMALGAMMFGAGGNPDHDDSIRVIHAALDAGINLVDTADVYSSGESEIIVGQAIKGRRDDVVLATKFCLPMGADPNQSGGSRRWITRAVENSLRRLGTDHIDLYQMHRPDPATDVGESLSALSDLVHAGKVRAIGSSTFPAELRSRPSGPRNVAASSASSPSSPGIRCSTG